MIKFLSLIWEYKLLAVVLALITALGIQTYRLQGAQGEVLVLETEAKARKDRDALRALHNLKNTERTNEEFAAASKRAATVVVRSQPTGIKPSAVFAGGGQGTDYCLSRRELDQELASFSRRHVERLDRLVADVSRRGDERLTRLARQNEALAAAYRACRSYALNQSE